MKRAFRSACVGVEPWFERGICAQRDMTVPIAKLCFWGVRGSTPTVDPATWRYGGETPCLGRVAPDGARNILDCGPGPRVLGGRWGAPDGGGERAGDAFGAQYFLGPSTRGSLFFARVFGEKRDYFF